MKSKSREI